MPLADNTSQRNHIIRLPTSLLLYVGMLLCLTSCLPHPGRLSKLPHDINTVQHKQPLTLSAAANNTMTIQYLGAGGCWKTT